MKSGEQLKPYEVYYLEVVNERRESDGDPPLEPEDIPDETWSKLEEIVYRSKPIMKKLPKESQR